MVRLQRIDPAHPRRVFLARRWRHPVDARTRQTQQRALPAHRRSFVTTVEPARRSAALIFRTSPLKNPAPQILKLLLLSVNLIGVNLVALGELVHRRLLAQRLQSDFHL